MSSISLSLHLPENSSKYVLETPMNNLSYLQFFVSFLKRTGVLQGFRHETQKTPNKTEVEKTECPFFLDFFYPAFTFQRDITFLFSSGNVV